MTNYMYPDVLPRAAACSLICEGKPVPLFELHDTLFTHFAISGPCDFELRLENALPSIPIRPERLKIASEIRGNTLRFRAEQAADLCIEIDQRKPLLLFIDDANAPAKQPPDDAIRFAAGQVHEVGQLHIRSGQTVHIEPGAIVKGTIHSAAASDIAITGRGILDGGFVFGASGVRERLILLEACRNVLVEGITMIRPSSWMLVLADCEHAEVRKIRQIGEVVSSDGIDIVGSRHVHVHHGFLKNNDDCVAVKAIARGDYGFHHCDLAKDVFDVLVEQCALWNDRAGNAMEIGFETRCHSIRDITFRDIDVIGAHGFGGVFTIHGGDRAHISHILYQDIRVEHMFDRMIDFEVMHSRYSKDAARGQIRDITFRRIRTLKDIYNSINLVGGYDADHVVDGIVFDDFQMGGVTMKSADDLQLFTRHARDIRF